ncbi:MAG: 16S rRNA processing protein RimM [Deltaproteobacteria bacterium]|nr:16S rRNA processing protein RimM [Deltaproteobacteria bacterium]
MEIGRVTRPHGVRGEVRVQLHWGPSDTLETVDRVELSRDGVPLGSREIRGARRAERAYLVAFAGVGDRDAAEALRGASVSVARAELPPLGPGEYYLSDLLGATVRGPSGVIGEVVDLRVHPTVDSLVIRRPDGELVEQPLSEAFLESVDPLLPEVVLATEDGLF